MHPVAEAEACFRESKGKTAAGDELEVDVAENQPAQMSDVGSIAGVADRADQRDECENSYQVLEADRDREGEHVNFLIAKEHGASHQDGVNPARCADGSHCWGEVNEGTESIGQRHGPQPCAYDPKQIKFPEPPAAPVGFQHGAE